MLVLIRFLDAGKMFNLSGLRWSHYLRIINALSSQGHNINKPGDGSFDTLSLRASYSGQGTEDGNNMLKVEGLKVGRLD